MDINALYLAWDRWDHQPTSRDAVIRLQAEINLVAIKLDCTNSEFYELVGGLRRREYKLREALEKAVELFQT